MYRNRTVRMVCSKSVVIEAGFSPEFNSRHLNTIYLNTLTYASHSSFVDRNAKCTFCIMPTFFTDADRGYLVDEMSDAKSVPSSGENSFEIKYNLVFSSATRDTSNR